MKVRVGDLRRLIREDGERGPHYISKLLADNGRPDLGVEYDAVNDRYSIFNIDDRTKLRKGMTFDAAVMMAKQAK